jgi:aminoglycoside phosphotransferase (APT) family kinase protein
MKPSEAIVLDELKRQLPGLRPKRLVPLGEGMDFYAYELDEETIIRVPQRRELEPHLIVEVRLLDCLSRSSPLAVPKPTFLGSPSRRLPFGFMIYRKIEGTSALQMTTRPTKGLAVKLGALLNYMYRFPRRTAAAIGLEVIPVERSITEALTQARIDRKYLKRYPEQIPIDACLHYLASFSAKPLNRRTVLRLCHCDLYPEHILIDRQGRRIVGVIDWADAAVTDSAIDLAGAMYWGGLSFAQNVLEAVDAKLDSGILERAGFYTVCRALSDVRYGMHPKNAPYLSAAIEVLSRVESFCRP